MPDDEKKPSSKKVVGGAISAAILLLGALGFVAQTSRRDFLGLPPEKLKEGIVDIITAAAPEGLMFLWVSFTDIGFRYMGANVRGIIIAAGLLLIIISAGAWMVVRRRRSVIAFEPLLVLPLIFGAAVFFILRNLAPSTYFRDVLREKSVTADFFSIPARSAKRASEIWMDVVCTKIGTSPKASMCRQYTLPSYERRHYGRYFIHFAGTGTLLLLYIICYISERKRIFRATTTIDVIRTLLFVVTGIAVLISVIGLPYVYSRTVRSTDFPIGRMKNGARGAAFRICTSADCVGYRVLIADWVDASQVEDSGKVDDALKAHMLDALGEETIVPPPRAGFGETK